jgi:predicted ATPase/DNA-binding winged helix-turn-helix (wHTH) protein
MPSRRSRAAFIASLWIGQKGPITMPNANKTAAVWNPASRKEHGLTVTAPRSPAVAAPAGGGATFPQARGVISFGPFCLNVSERLLERDGVPVALGARAFDILAALAGRQGEVVEKKELMEIVWPGVIVDEGTLRFHMNGVRKALGDGRDGARYITTIAGRGYCFVFPTTHGEAVGQETERAGASEARAKLPSTLARMIGRDETVSDVTEELLSKRFVTIVGPGGIGKSTLAIAIAHQLMEPFDSCVRFVDLSSTTDAQLVPSMVASAVGFVAHATDIVPNLVDFLADKKMLIILDSCEHVIEHAARVADAIFANTPDVYILATSREALRVDGEQVHQLSPLPTPPGDNDLGREAVLWFSAVQLFIERVTASGVRFHLTDADAPVVARICRDLDGIPLAIELAAGRVSAYGVEGIAELLGDRFALLGNARRTANPRHQTLSTTLDWSYNLLGLHERTLLRRLSIFAGPFSLKAAVAAAAFGDLGEMSVLDGVGNLISKSLISADLSGRSPNYRLLDTTRTYLRDKLRESGELRDVAYRHALHYLNLLEDESQRGAAAEQGAAAARDYLGNIRAGLAWCFSEDGDPELGTSLAAAAGPLLVELSLLAECCKWAKRAIEALNESTLGTLREINLQAALGHSLMFTEGNSDRVRECFKRGVDLARQLDQPLMELRLLGGLHLYNERTGNYRGAVEFAERSDVVAQAIGHPAALAAAGSFLGLSQHLVGNHEAARALLQKALTPDIPSPQANSIHFGFDYRNRSRITLARHHWLVGEVDQATALAEQTIADAAKLRHPVTLCIALIWGITVALWAGDAEGSEQKIEAFVAHAKKHSLNPYTAIGVGYRGELCVLRGDGETGVKLLTQALESLHAARYELVTTTLMIALAQGLEMTGRWSEALGVIDHAQDLVETNGDLLYLPEVFRTKGVILAGEGRGDPAAAEASFQAALECARRQSALSWELRTATSYAGLMASQGRLDEAEALLASIFARFTEGSATKDLQAAQALLEKLRRTPQLRLATRSS